MDQQRCRQSRYPGRGIAHRRSHLLPDQEKQISRASPRTRAFAWSLVGLAFFSKISFSFTGLVPSSLPYVLFQGGIHPYLNVGLNLLLGLGLAISLARDGAGLPPLRAFHPAYPLFALGAIALLWVQHLLQLALGIAANGPLALATLGACTFLIAVFGLLIPRVIEGEEFLRGTSAACLAICAVSVALWLVGAPALYKGARFAGIMKHIPYMVTCSTAGFLLHFTRWRPGMPLVRKLFFLGSELLMLFCVYLTGTRSALFAAAAGLFLFFLAQRAPSAQFRLARLLAVWLVLVATVLFGGSALEFGKDLATGKASLGQRAPQDGLSDRLEEITRGLSMLEESPNVGLGLLSKFSSSDPESMVGSYNSFQDPHNLFISSAVVAGWPFGAWILWGFLALGLGSAVAVWSRQEPGFVLGIYLLTHLPILSIYHMHLSLGGLADRLYWLAFGYLALFLGERRRATISPVPSSLD